jgi:hypothetical protein
VTTSTATVKDRSTGTRKVLAAILAFALVSVFVIRTSNAAFTADETNSNNEFYTATIDLTANETVPLFGDPDGGLSPLVDATGLAPGSSVNECIEITFVDETGNVADLDAVTLEVASPVTALAAALDVTVRTRTGGCAGGIFGAGLTGTLSAFGTQTSAWVPSGDGDTAGYDVTVTLNSGADDTLQGQSVTDVDLVWSVSTS